MAGERATGKLRDPYFRFFTAFFAALFLGLLYPLTLWFSLPHAADVAYYLKIELSWSFAALIFLPIGMGLSFASFDVRLLPLQQRGAMIGGLVFVVAVLGVIGSAVIADAGGIPEPHRLQVRSHPEVQASVVQLDQCLRTNSIADCQSRGMPVPAPQQIAACVSERGDELDRTLFAAPSLAEPLDKKRSYYCALRLLLAPHGLAPSNSVFSPAAVSRTPVSYMATFLNFLFAGLIWLMMCWIGYLSWNFYKKTPLPTIYVCAAWLTVLSSWFPLRLYSETLLWYGDVHHITDNAAFVVLASIAFLLAVHVAVWLLAQRNENLMATLSGAWALAGILVAAVGLIFKDATQTAILDVWSWQWPFLLLLGIALVGGVAIYVRLVIAEYAAASQS